MGKFKLLAISAGRRLGNSEILLKAAMKAAESLGDIDVALIRLQDVNIKHCLGCESCINTTLSGGDGKCVQTGDDFLWLFDQTLKADGILLGTPIYNLLPPGILINVLNRAIGSGVAHQNYCRTHPKHGGIICVGGSDWTDLGMPVATLALGRLAKYIICEDRMLVDYTNKKGMVLLNDDAIRRAKQLGVTVGKAVKGIESGPGVSGACPGCGSDLMNFSQAPSISCAMCGAKGTLTVAEGKPAIVFSEDCTKINRFTARGFAAHLEEVNHCHKIASEGKELIDERIAEYRDYGHLLHP